MMINNIDQRSVSVSSLKTMSVLSKSAPGSPLAAILAEEDQTEVLPVSSESIRVDLTSIQTEASKEIPVDQNRESIQRMIEEANKRVTDLQFDISQEERAGIVLRIVDRETGNIIRQIPPEEMIRMRDHFENLKGLLFSQES